jgi:predicted dehydrogenase
MSKRKSRREFVADAGKLALGAAVLPQVGFPTIVPAHVLSGRGHRTPSAGLNIAIVGAGGMGRGNAQQMMSENLVAFCDVDMVAVTRAIENGSRPNAQGRAPSENAVRLNEAFQKAGKYTDFREMLAKQPDIDAVVIATPDHNHAVVAAAAMKAGKHVYVQKPLTYSVYESRLLAKLARENPRLVTQMGNQGHSREGTRRVVEWIQAGVIGNVREVHIYTDRPARFWAQGLPRPAATQTTPVLPQGNIGRVNAALAAAMANTPVTMPDGLRWDLYLGPVAEDIPYHPVYHPFTWRGWVDFGVGALGDMGAHLIDQAYWALNLTQPTSLEGTSSLWGTVSIPLGQKLARESIVEDADTLSKYYHDSKPYYYYHDSEHLCCDRPMTELGQYLQETRPGLPPSCKPSVLQWWKEHSLIYPTISQMARDILALPCSIDSRVATRTAGLAMCELAGENHIEMFVCTQDWLTPAGTTCALASCISLFSSDLFVVH